MKNRSRSRTPLPPLSPFKKYQDGGSGGGTTGSNLHAVLPLPGLAHAPAFPFSQCSAIASSVLPLPAAWTDYQQPVPFHSPVLPAAAAVAEGGASTPVATEESDGEHDVGTQELKDELAKLRSENECWRKVYSGLLSVAEQD